MVIASNLGYAHHPHWWLNLAADPNATVEIGSSRYTVTARAAKGEERKEMWQAVATIVPDYDDYKASKKRQIPVVVLQKR